MKSLTLEKDAIIMSTAELKEELHQYIDQGDKKLLHMMQALAKDAGGRPQTALILHDRLAQIG